MKLYRPVLIESAEQAEALPAGTVAHRVLKFESTWDTVEQPEVAVKVGISAWCSTAVDDDAWDWLDRHLVGWTALLPIEAEEEWALIYDGEEPTPCADEADAREWARIDGEGQAPSRRYTTIWEETP